MRRLLQFVMIVALLSGSDAFVATMMPCCAPALVTSMPAEMQMPSAASCHGADSTAMPSDGSMSMQAAPMIRCPRAVANVQASAEWKSSEQAESYSSLQVAKCLPANKGMMPPLLHRISDDSRRNDPSVPNSNTPLPLRV